MKMSYRALIVLSILAAVFSPPFIYFALGQKVSKGESAMMAEFGKAVNKFKKVAAKNPEGKTATLLKDIDKVDADAMNEEIVIDIGKKLDKDSEIKEISSDIKKQTDKHPKVITKTFQDKDPDGFPAYKKKLRKGTIKCGGLGLVKASKREKYELGAFKVSAEYLEKYDS